MDELRFLQFWLANCKCIYYTSSMSTLINKIMQVYRQIRGLFPSSLPQGMTEFEAFYKRISSTYALPTVDESSIKFVLAATITNLKSTEDKRADYFFVKILRATAAKQVAGQVFTDIKNAQKAATEAAKPAAQVIPIDKEPA